MENYITLLDKHEVGSVMCKLRISTHPLEIEKWQHEMLPVGERTCECNYCISKPVKDEIHGTFYF